VNLASRGLRDMDGGVERIEDAAVRAQVQRQARRVYVRGVLWATALTALALLVP
jgi:hypothetical protein